MRLAIYEALFYSTAQSQPRIINDCTGIIKSVDTEKEEEKNYNSVQPARFEKNISPKRFRAGCGVTLLPQDIRPGSNQ